MFGPMLVITQTKIGERYHPLVLRESPLPGPPDPSRNIVRLRSHGHHTDGFNTEEEAAAHIKEMQEQAGIPDENVAEGIMVGYDGSACSFIAKEWRGTGHKVDLRNAL